jgi:hypothetical protein
MNNKELEIWKADLPQWTFHIVYFFVQYCIRLIWKVMNILTVYGVIFKRECALNYNVQINYWSKLKIKVVWDVESLHFYIDNSIERKNKLYEKFIEASQPSISLTLCCSFVYETFHVSHNFYLQLTSIINLYIVI